MFFFFLQVQVFLLSKYSILLIPTLNLWFRHWQKRNIYRSLSVKKFDYNNILEHNAGDKVTSSVKYPSQAYFPNTGFRFYYFPGPYTEPLVLEEASGQGYLWASVKSLIQHTFIEHLLWAQRCPQYSSSFNKVSACMGPYILVN